VLSSFTVLDLTLRLLIHFELTLVQGERLGSSFSFSHSDKVFPAPFVEKAVFCSMYVLVSFVKNQMFVAVGFISGRKEGF
jgi:hypothetical protein